MYGSDRADIEQGQTPSIAIERALWVVGLLSLVFSFIAIGIGFHHSIFEFHGFRQAQTAISAYSILQGGSFLHYETPVMGPPWSLPFEFPLYQGIVAGLAKLISAPLDETGRFISILFYYLSFFPLASILARLGLRRTMMIPVLALFAMSPIYIFVSRLFMIESTALFFSLMYADQMFRLVLNAKRWPYRHIAGAAIFGVLAGLVKVTTLAPFFMLGAGLAAWQMWKDRKKGILMPGLAATVSFFCVALPVAVTYSWTKFADKVKAENPMGAYLTSKALSGWNYGTLAQRLNPRSYLHFIRATDNNIGSFFIGLLVVAFYVWLCRTWNWIPVICLSLYAGTIAIFFNLHLAHEYYPYSNSIFLVVAIGMLLTSILKLPGRRAWIGFALLLITLAACGRRYLTHYYPYQKTNAPGRPTVAALVDKLTAPQSVIMVTGVDWSSELPYQSHRRAIMDAIFIPTWPAGTLEPIEQSIANEGAHNIAMLIACDDSRYGTRVPSFVKELGLASPASLHADHCDLYQRAPQP